jgi:hypothetical protein
MANLFMKIWNDPVWSKVIAAGIIAILGVIGGIISLYRGPAYHFLGYPTPLWLGLIFVAVAFAVGIWVDSRRFDGPYTFEPVIKLTGVEARDANPAKPLSHPVKIGWTFRNDSPGCVTVSLHDFRPKNIKLEGLPPGVLQVLMGQQWLPIQDGMAEVALLPGQMFKGWVPVDQTLYTAAQVRRHMNNLGTLFLKVNDELQNFEL